MKRSMVLILTTVMVLSGCASKELADVKPQETTVQTTEEETTETVTTEEETTKAPEEVKTMSVAEFDELLAGLPVSVIKTDYLVQDEQYKSLYPDMLSTVIQNNTDSDIKDAIIGLVAWDSNQLPVKIIGNMDFTDGAYFRKVNYDDINLISGGTFGETSGFSIDEGCSISSFRPIIVSFETFDGDTWKNPYVDSFLDAYEGKKYSDDITVEVKIKDAAFQKSEIPADTKVESGAEDALNEALMAQPLYVSNTKYVVQDDQFKSLYPDMLQVILQNNSEDDIRDAVVAFAAWDSNGLPVKIKGHMSFNDPVYITKVNFGDINLVPGGSFGDSQGYSIDENCEISTFKAVVVSYTTFEDQTWENPKFKDFCELYEGKRMTQ